MVHLCACVCARVRGSPLPGQYEGSGRIIPEKREPPQQAWASTGTVAPGAVQLPAVALDAVCGARAPGGGAPQSPHAADTAGASPITASVLMSLQAWPKHVQAEH